MSRVCDICGKGPVAGRMIMYKGLSKKKGGIGLNITGITKRRFMPNIQKIKVIEGGTVMRKKVCTRCIKGGKITKA
jgi:large subunit ribosomal protein L28